MSEQLSKLLGLKVLEVSDEEAEKLELNDLGWTEAAVDAKGELGQ